MRKILFYILFAAAFFVNSYPQSFRMQSYTLDDGIPDFLYLDAAQDKTGLMYFACNNGIVTYSGTEWELLQQRIDIPAGNYRHLMFDDEGTLWALSGYEAPRLVYRKNGEWIIIQDTGNPDFDLLTSFDVLITSKQILPVIPGIKEYVVAVGTRDRGLFIHKEGKWINLTKKDGLPADNVTDIQAKDDKFYISTSGGLAVYEDSVLRKLYEYDKFLKNKPIIELEFFSIDRNPENERLWLLGTDWMGYIEKGKLNIVTQDFYLVGWLFPGSNFIEYDGVDRIFFGNNNNFFYYNVHTGKTFELGRQSGFLYDGATDIFLDREENLWITTVNGINKIPKSPFINYYEATGLLENDIASICFDSDDRVILGHNRGITIFKGSSIIRKAFDIPKYDYIDTRVLEIYKDSRDTMWLAAQKMGLGIVHANNEITWYPNRYAKINCMLEDSANGYFAGCEEGLYYFTENRYYKIDLENDPVFTRKLFWTRDSSLAICSGTDGLVIKRSDSEKSYLINNRATSTYAYYEDTTGIRLVGTSEGLYFIDGDSLALFSYYNQQITNSVYFINGGLDSTLWLGTDNGLFKLNDGAVQSYSIKEGLAGFETNRSAGKYSPKGEFWTGTSSGLSIYKPDYDYYQYSPPRVNLLFLRDQTGKSYPLNSPVTLPHDMNNVTIHFQGLSYVNERELRFNVKLFNESNEIISEFVTTGSSVLFNKLEPGFYTVSVKMENARGVMSETVTSSVIEVEAPFFSQTLVIIILLIGGILGAFVIVRFYSKRKYYQLLEDEVINRTRELENSEKAYRESELRLRQLAENINAAFWLNDLELKKFIYVSSGYELLWGKKAETLYKDRNSWIESVHNDHISNVILSFENEKAGVPFEDEFKIIREDGTQRWIHYRSFPIKDATGKTYRIASIAEDVTARRAAENELLSAKKKAEEASRLKSALLKNMSHEFRTPLNGILGLTSILEEEVEDEDSKDIVRKILLSGKRLMNTLNSILDLSQIETNKNIVRLGNTELVKTAKKVVDDYKLDAENKGLDLIFSLPDKEVIINMNSKFCGQIITNLLDNAIKFTEKGNVMISIVTYSDSSSKYAEVKIADTGIGIEPEYQDVIFQEFRQASEGFGRRFEGSGLGLSIVKRVVEQAGGIMKLQSSPQKGSEFSLKLPLIETDLERKDDSVEETLTRAAEKKKKSRSKPKALLVEDNEVNRELPVIYLRDMCQVDTAPNGETALKMAENKKYDIILMDINLGEGMNGLETAREIRKIEGYSSTPIIAITGYAMAGDEEELLKEGLDFYLAKPFKKKEIRSLISDILGLSN